MKNILPAALLLVFSSIAIAQSYECRSRCTGSQNYRECTATCEQQDTGNVAMGPLRALWAGQEEARKQKASQQEAEMRALELERLRLQNEALKRQLEQRQP